MAIIKQNFNIMKNQMKFFALSAIIIIAAACSSGGTKTEATDAQDVKSGEADQVFTANTNESLVEWQGWKPTGNHYGSIDISNGDLEVNDGKLVGGSFTIDMNSITVVDLKDAEDNANLTGHLKSADFFEVSTYPMAQFEITEVKAIDGTKIDKSKEKGEVVPTHAITGNLTMKDITKSITFNAKVAMSDDQIKAHTNQFYIDRAQWNVRYGSKSFFDDLKDNFINDEMGITITLVADQSKEMASSK